MESLYFTHIKYAEKLLSKQHYHYHNHHHPSPGNVSWMKELHSAHTHTHNNKKKLQKVLSFDLSSLLLSFFLFLTSALHISSLVRNAPLTIT